MTSRTDAEADTPGAFGRDTAVSPPRAPSEPGWSSRPPDPRSRSLRRLPGLVVAALRLLHVAAPRTLRVVLVLQVSTALLAGVQVLLGQAALRALLAPAGPRGVLTVAVVVPLLLVALVSAVAGLLGAAQGLQQRLLGELATREVNERILRVTTHVDLSTFEHPEFHDRLQRVSAGASLRPVLVAQGLTGLVGGVVGGVGLVLALVAVAPLLVPLVLLAGLPLFVANRRAGNREFAFHVRQIEGMRRRGYLSGLLRSGAAAQEVRAYGTARWLMSMHDRSYEEYVGDLRCHLRARQRLALVGNAGALVLTSAVVVALLWALGSGRLTLAAAGAALLGVRLLGARVTAAVGGLAQLYESALFFDDLRQFLSSEPASGLVAAPGPVVPAFGHVDLERVTFRYPGAQATVLHDVSVRLRRGEVVALVGENGSGKTTLAKLLAGLYRPGDGRLLCDGRDVADLPQGAWSSQVAVLFQDYAGYALTGHENIGLGRVEALDDREGVRCAARLAGADAFLTTLPHGYDTVLSKEFPQGAELSMGQWQRVALARAVFRDAGLVILDEPSAALDPRAEHELFGKARDLFQGKAVLLISHRLSTVRTADRIYVLREGRVVEEGDHASLMGAGGLYAELFELQASGYRGDVPASSPLGPPSSS